MADIKKVKVEVSVANTLLILGASAKNVEPSRSDTVGREGNSFPLPTIGSETNETEKG